MIVLIDQMLTCTLIDNHIGDAGATQLAAALQHNSTLTSLNLKSKLFLLIVLIEQMLTCTLIDNDIGAAGATQLAAALQHNSTLTSLNLSSKLFYDCVD